MKKLFLSILVLGFIFAWGVNAAVVEYPNPLRCSFTNYEEPCTCEKEPNFIKKSYCELKMKQSNKITRGEAASVCARRAEEYLKKL